MTLPPLRVLHLNAERGWRGGERQTLWLAEALRRMGHESVIAGWPDGPLLTRAAAVGIATLGTTPRMPIDPVSALRLSRELATGRFDVLHAHTGNALTQAVLAIRPRRTALIGAKRVDRPAHGGMLTRLKHGRADAMIAVSHHVRDVLVEGGAPADRVTVVPDGVDLARVMTPASRDTLRALGVSGDVPLVVMVAALVPTKAPEVFLAAVADAVQRGARLEVLLVGDGPMRAELVALRTRLGIESVLHLTGWRDDTDALIAAADIVALTSRGEGQGSVLLDAMQCGRAVVATRVGGIPDAVVDGETGILAPAEDAAALGAALARLAGDEPLRARMGAAGRQRVAQFSLDRVAGLTVDVYRAALARRIR